MKKHGIARLIILSGITAASLAGVLAGCDFNRIKYDLGIFEKHQDYTVTYEAPGADGPVPQPETVTGGTSITLAGQGALAREGYKFDGWLTPEGLRQPGESYTVTENITFYAQWTQVFTVTYDLNGGSGKKPADVTGVAGLVQVASAADLTPPPGKVFVGWTKNKNGEGTRYRSDSTASNKITVTGNITLYAQWGYSVTYNANGATAGTPPATAYLLPGETLTVASGRTLKKNGMNFIAWSRYQGETEW
ncbi:MAG: InlB B-repeat-containing protein, partial [Spirochaetaceae bacterium]|nr:InlB B-repeat-containing protein [Spirochaetaceae bacterium]